MPTHRPFQPQAGTQEAQENERCICVFTPSPLYTITVEEGVSNLLIRIREKGQTHSD
jgi:hypothetical protein